MTLAALDLSRAARACALASGLLLAACGGDDTTNPALVDAGPAKDASSSDATTSHDGATDAPAQAEAGVDAGDAGKEAGSDAALDGSADAANDVQNDSAIEDAADEGG